jgi:diguanylate cyclase (GGDEF)-like protein/PAS domain S-box-containing protein
LVNTREPQVIDVAAMRMREATIAAGILLTFGVGGFGEAYVALTWSRPHRTGLAILFALAMLGALLVLLLPRERIVRSRLREPFFLAWTFLDFAMLVVGTLADGGTASPLVLVFFIPVVFSLMSYPLGSVVVVGILSVVSYLALAFAAGGSSWTYQGAFAGSLLCTAAMSAWQAQNHNRQHRALAQVSRTDPLTGCLNRRGFEESARAELARLARRGLKGAVVVLDIDHFKPVNDSFGHAAGDELLCWTTETLEQLVRPTDSVGRLGGDEFAVLLSEVDAEAAQAGAERIDRALRDRAPSSLGLAIFPDDGTELELLCRRADARLYASRESRRDYDRRPHPQGKAHDDRSSAPQRAPDEFESLPVWRAAVDALPRPAGADARAEGARSLDNELLDQIDASVVGVDMSGTIVSWNRGAEALYGWRREEAIGASARDLIVPADADPAERLRDRVSAEGRWDGELLVRRKDGSLFTAYVRNRLVLDDDGEPAAIVGVAVDVSKRVAAESEQRRDAAKLACLNDVEHALREDRLVLHAQPIIDLQSGTAVQHELLLRMIDRSGETVSPAEFLPIVEQYALIRDVDRWVVEQATRLAGEGCPVQLNVSARSVGDADVLEHIERCIRRNRVAPGLLVFEITETAIVEDERAALTFAERLHALGCRLALDDFGTGYGTLTYLKRIPVDYLKIDIEFVRDLRGNEASRHVVQAVVSLAHDFGVQTVAEGVEDAETLALLAQFGVDFAQGFHIARPAPFAELPGDRGERATSKRRPTQHRERTRTRRTPKSGQVAGGVGRS